MGAIKRAAVLLLSSCLLQEFPAFSQQPDDRLTLSEKNANLEHVLLDIQHLTGYTFVGQPEFFQECKGISFSVKSATVKEVMDQCLKGKPFWYEFVGHAISIHRKTTPDPASLIAVHGRVINEKNDPVVGATILLMDSGPPGGNNNTSTDGNFTPPNTLKVAAITDTSGAFSIRVPVGTHLLISHVNYQKQEEVLSGNKEVLIILEHKVSGLEDVVIVNDGFQKRPKDRLTGSFEQINNELINRRVSPNILDRIDGVASGVAFTKNMSLGDGQAAISIRGRSTLLSNPNPLIVVDNFPYTGDISNINPDDVDNVTILKDAAAASIWGAFSGNGVIVITTKKGKLNQAPKFTFNSSVTFGKRLDLYYLPVLSSSDYVDVEQFLFQNHYYDYPEHNGTHSALSPVVEILIKQRDGLITPAEATAQLNVLRNQDVRQDLNKYFYQPLFNQQYSLNLTGGGEKNHYYLSAGYDKNKPNQVRNEYDRISLNGSSTYILYPKKLELTTGLAFTASTSYNNSLSFNYRPYVRYADPNGNALPVYATLRQSYVDTVGGGKLLDWHYVPLDELHNSDNKTKLIDYRFNIGFKWTMLKGFNWTVSYQYGHGQSDKQNYQSLKTYSARDLINEFTQIDSAGNVIRHIPIGGILDEQLNLYDAHNARLQANYTFSPGQEQEVNLLGGAELRDIETNSHTSRIYGYDKDRQNTPALDYTFQYPQFTTPGILNTVPFFDHISSSSDRYLSFYFNGGYTYKQRYTLTASVRKDESNLFGVNADKRGVPLWSVGGAWEISKEPWYRLDWLPLLRLRVSDGYNGNVNKQITGLITTDITAIQLYSNTNYYGANFASINNPPNPELRWEKVNIFNTGLDFSIKKGQVDGTFEYYIKKGSDLIAPIPIDPTTGNTQYIGNVANMVAHGMDLTLRANFRLGPVQWNSVLLFSRVLDRVTNYLVTPAAISNYFYPGVNPMVGKPVYSVYVLRSAGLDPLTGDPRGWLNGQISKDYGTILNSPHLSDLVYVGPLNPTYFGSWRNTFSWKQWGLSFNILYKFGYYFRRSSIDYSRLFLGNSNGHSDYSQRWQHPGDEAHTNVPSIIYPNDLERDAFYGDSQVLIEKGDHIRLQDLQLSFDWQKPHFPKLPVQLIRFYAYANNIGIIWKANHQHIDPDAVLTIPNPRTLALGIKMEF